MDEPRHEQRGRHDRVGQPHVESVADEARVGDERGSRSARPAALLTTHLLCERRPASRSTRAQRPGEPRRRQQPGGIRKETGERESLSRHLERRECHASLEVRDDAVHGLQVDQIRQHENDHRAASIATERAPLKRSDGGGESATEASAATPM